MVHTSASRPGVPGSNPIAAPKSYEVYPSTSGLLSFNKPETVLWTIAKKLLLLLLMRPSLADNSLFLEASGGENIGC